MLQSVYDNWNVPPITDPDYRLVNDMGERWNADYEPGVREGWASQFDPESEVYQEGDCCPWNAHTDEDGYSPKFGHYDDEANEESGGVLVYA